MDQKNSESLTFAELINQEVEYVALSRDTTESDLKQRREMWNGTAFFEDQVRLTSTTISNRFSYTTKCNNIYFILENEQIISKTCVTYCIEMVEIGSLHRGSDYLYQSLQKSIPCGSHETQ